MRKCRYTTNGALLNSRMKEAESLVAPKATTHLYHSLAFVVIQFIKSLMTFEPDDLNNAIEGCKNCLTLCNLLRKQLGTTETLSRWVKGAPGAATISSMTAVERHAELAYAECLVRLILVASWRVVIDLCETADQSCYWDHLLRVVSQLYRRSSQYACRSRDIPLPLSMG